MRVDSISLSNFRNYQSVSLELDPGVNVIVGNNATGKTNLVEALALISSGESFRAKKIDEMVRFGEEWGRVNLTGINEKDSERMELGIMVSGGMVMGKTVRKRVYFINGVSKSKSNFVGMMPSVVFRPEDLELLDGSPGIRRSFLDRTLGQVDGEYRRSLSTYEQALLRRNKLLDAIRDGLANRYALTFWNGLLVKHGQEIERKRDELIEQINTLWSRSDLFSKLKLVYDKSIISESRLEQYKEEEVAAGYTLVGPHKDDFQVEESNGDVNRNLSIYGSRGEQRMAVLALKMGEVYFIEERRGERVLLLLDDVFSELDKVHKGEVLRLMQSRQVVVSTADELDLHELVSPRIIRMNELRNIQ